MRTLKPAYFALSVILVDSAAAIGYRGTNQRNRSIMMDKFWSRFWKFFGIAWGIAFFGGIGWGIAAHSGGLIYNNVQKIVALGLGVCGTIGIVVVPIELYVRDRMKNSAACAGGSRRGLNFGDAHVPG
jgi:hypothetical protein